MVEKKLVRLILSKTVSAKLMKIGNLYNNNDLLQKFGPKLPLRILKFSTANKKSDFVKGQAYFQYFSVYQMFVGTTLGSTKNFNRKIIKFCLTCLTHQKIKVWARLKIRIKQQGDLNFKFNP